MQLNKSFDCHLNVSPKSASKRPPLMNLDRKHYMQLTDREFCLLARLAVLTNNGTQPCNYTNAQASKEFGLPSRTTELTFSMLKQFELIKLDRMQNLSTKRGPKLRTVTIIAPLVVHKKAAQLGLLPLKEIQT